MRSALATLFGPDLCGYFGIVEDWPDKPLRWVEPVQLIAGPEHWERRAEEKRRAWLPRRRSQPRGWTAQDDAILCDAISNGKTFREAGAVLCRSKGACIGRFHRLAKMMGAA